MARSAASAAREAVRSRSKLKLTGRNDGTECETGHPAVAQVSEAVDLSDGAEVFDLGDETTMDRMPEGGGYPKGFVRLAADLMGVPTGIRALIVHLCSGSVRAPLSFDLRCGPRCICATEDLGAPKTEFARRALASARRNARDGCEACATGPSCLADVRRLPIATASVRWVLADPPYSEDYAEALWGMGRSYPTPATILREAARILVPGGQIALLHQVVPTMPAVRAATGSPVPLLERLRVYGVTTGPGYRIRALTIARRIEVPPSLFDGG